MIEVQLKHLFVSLRFNSPNGRITSSKKLCLSGIFKTKVTLGETIYVTHSDVIGINLLNYLCQFTCD